MNKEEILSFLKKRKVQWILTSVFLLIILLWSSSIRLSNWDLLVDQTTGEKIPADIDALYFLRLSEELLERGSLGEVDVMRYTSANVPYLDEKMPQILVGVYKIGNLFGDYTIREVNVFSPVLFFFVGLILFFFLIYSLTNSKLASLASTTFLAFIPSYLIRTMAGFSDHEAIGMIGFFAALLMFSISLKGINRDKSLLKSSLFSLGCAFFTSISIALWSGVANFLFMIIPFSFLILWMSKLRNEEKDFIKRGILFYGGWMILTPITSLIFGYSFGEIVPRFMLGTAGLLTLFVLGYIIIDFLLIRYKHKIKFVKESYREIYTLGVVFILGVIGLFLIGRNIFIIIKDVWIRIFHPWGLERASLTVAENAQPYLVDWINQSGLILFWMFFLGVIFLGIEMSKGFEKKKSKILVSVGWIILTSSILLSRISPSSLLNGTNFISQTLYVLGFLVSIAFFLKAYFSDKIKISPELTLILSWIFFSLISGRASVRIFFVLSPVVSFMAVYLLLKLWNYSKKNKDQEFFSVVRIILILSIIMGFYVLYSSHERITPQAQSVGPIANYQWQNGMNWVRENTPENSVFVHWWDYGYLVQTLGKRPSVTDGGHAFGYWDHLIGRYLLTTPNPDTAYSLMKTNNVSYLIIDPTDLGKYGAFSKIGSDNSGEDRFASIPIMILDLSQSVESDQSTTLVYTGGAMTIDGDIDYTFGNQKIFLPANKAIIVGIIWERFSVSGGNSQFEQPVGVYYYNNQRYDIPLRYIYFNGDLKDYGTGLEAVLRIVPSFDGSNIEEIGSIIYLSPKVADGLFAQLYLLDDVFNNYNKISVAHVEEDFVVSSLRSQGAPLNEFLYFQGLRAPLKIWKVDYPSNIIERPEFLETSGGYAELDNLEFTK